MDKTTLAQKFNITKPGHLKKLLWELSQLEDPTAGKFKAKYLLYLLRSNLVLKELHALSRIHSLSKMCFALGT